MSGDNASQDRVPTPDSDGSRPAGKSAAAQLSEKHSKSKARKRNVIIAIVVVSVVVLALALGLGLGLGLKKSKTGRRKGPNVLVVMTDDQDLRLDSMTVMPNVNKLIGEEGVTYQKHYCTVSICCPSRVNIFTGRAAHNTNVTAISPPYGGWQKFGEEGLNNDYLPVWISDAGVDTYYVGKFLNGYGKGNMHTPAAPKGWTNSSMLLEPWTMAYYNSHWTNAMTNDVVPFIGTHTTDVTQTKALAMLDDAATSGNQFFMMVAPVAPHQESWHGIRPPPVPERYRGMFANATTPKSANWNPDTPSGASWVYNMPKLDAAGIENCEQTYRHRLGNIYAVDVMVSELIQKLEDHGMLDNTYVIFTSDNGFHIGNHRLLPGKRCPYEEDINVPLLIRGPDVPKAINSSLVNSHTDLAPTILQMLGIDLRANFDGEPITYTQDTMAASNKSEMVNVEFWTSNGAPIGLNHGNYYNNTYKALRMLTGNESLYYSTWCTGEREFYDMNADFVQMNNRLAANATNGTAEYFGRPWPEILVRLDALLMVTKSCKQWSCRNPWAILFPKGQVADLETAMRPEYDSFFQNQPRISFSACGAGYFIADEGPQYVNVFGGGTNVFNTVS